MLVNPKFRVAHLSAYWKAGAVAMCRTHDALRQIGVDSRVHVMEALDGSLANAHQLQRQQHQTSLKLRLLGDPGSWQNRIRKAGKTNARYELFTPPVAVAPHDISDCLGDIDILHLHWTGGCFDFEVFCAEVDVPVVWTLHDQNAYLGGFHYQGDVDAATTMLPLEYESRQIKRRALANLDLAVIPNSKWNADLALSTDVLPRHTVVKQIYFPLPLYDYAATEKAFAKPKFGIDPKRFVLGFASGALENRRKGFYDLLIAISRLPSHIREKITLLSFGTDPLAKTRSCVDVPWVHLGRVNDPIKQSMAYSAMDTFVISSIEEAFGQTPLEALACETAVVGTRAGGIPETVIDGKTGLLVQPRCPSELALGIVRMYESEGFRRECGVAGRALAATRHDPERSAQEHVSLYEQMIVARKQRLETPRRQAA